MDNEPQILSAKDWWKFLMDNNAKIKDEYGEEISLETLQHYVFIKRDGSNHSKEYPDGNWLDEEGNSFSSSEFS